MIVTKKIVGVLNLEVDKALTLDNFFCNFFFFCNNG
jgi:hypothetical protein